MVECGAYILSNRDGTKFYVGSSQDLDKRLKDHFRTLRRGVHHNQNLQRVWNVENELFMKRFITNNREEAFQLEQDMLDYHHDNPGLLNIGKSAYGGDNISRNPRREEIVAAMTETLRQQVSEMSQDERNLRWSRPGDKNGMFGKTHTPQVRALLSSINKGNTYTKGYKLSEAHCRLISERAKLRIGEKNSFYGKTHTVETRRKLSEALKGNLPPNAKGIVVNGVSYKSFYEAGRALGISHTVARWRTMSKNPKFANYQFVDKGPTTTEKHLEE